MAFGKRFTSGDVENIKRKRNEYYSSKKEFADKTGIKIKPSKKGEIASESFSIYESDFDINSITPKFIFDIEPCPAPRMTQSDKWKTDINHPDPKKRQRPSVKRYFDFKNELKRQCEINGYMLESVLNICFIKQMPESWSEKKKNQHDGRPHLSRPDRDNFLKAFQDSFNADDGFVWDGRTIKIWGRSSCIIVF